MNTVNIHRDSDDNDASTMEIMQFTGSGLSWASNIYTKDTDVKTPAPLQYLFEPGDGTFYGRNAAEMGTDVALQSDSSYRIRGFNQRDINNIDANFGFVEAQCRIGTSVCDTTHLVADFIGQTSGGGANYVSTLTETAGSFNYTIVDSSGNLDANGTHIMCLDPNVYLIT